MSDATKDLRVAVESLKLVAEALHTPLDTSAVESALRAVEREKGGSSSDSKTENVGQDAKATSAPKAEERKPVGVPKES